MADIIDKLRERKSEVEELLDPAGPLGNWGSQRKEVLTHIKNALEGLIFAYSQPPSPALSLLHTEEILSQYYGLEEQKKKILEDLKIRRYAENRGIKLAPSIICLVGPAGVGKTKFTNISNC